MSVRFQQEIDGRFKRIKKEFDGRIAAIEGKLDELVDSIRKLAEGPLKEPRKPINPHKKGLWPKPLEQAGFKPPKREVAQKEESDGSDEG